MLWHVYKASQHLVPQQRICKARTEGIIWFSIYSSGQFLQQSILINKQKPCKKNQTAFESFLLQQAGLWGLINLHTHPSDAAVVENKFYLGFKTYPALLSKCQNTKLSFPVKFWKEKNIHTYKQLGPNIIDLLLHTSAVQKRHEHKG